MTGVRNLLLALFALQASGCTANDKAIERFLMKNPKVLEAALANLAETQSSEEASRIADQVANLGPRLYHPNVETIIGSRMAPEKIVMFSDSNCRFCKLAMRSALSSEKIKNGQLQLIVRDIAIVSPTSADFARFGIATARFGRYQAFQIAMMERTDGTLDQAQQLIIKHGIDYDATKQYLQSEFVSNTFAENNELARLLGVRSTPVFVVGSKIQRGWSPKDRLFD